MLDEYLAIDLSHESISYKSLFSEAASEVKAREIRLTGRSSELPSFITPAMGVWYRRHVAGPRGSALQHIKAAFESINKGGVSGFLLEVELDEIEERKRSEFKEDMDKFKQDRDVRDLHDALAKKTSEYQSMREHLGRDAKDWQPIQYWLGITSVIIIEGLINFESFTKIPGITPFFATGMTLAVASFIGYAAHRHGIFIRQFKELMGGHVGRRDKVTTLALDALGLLLLLVALGIVAWGRYNLLRDIIELSDFTGEDSLTAWLQLGGAMLGNIGVYLFGVLWSAWRHDDMPGYMELRIKKEKLEKEYNGRYFKGVTSRVRKAMSKAEEDANRKRKAESAYRSMPEYQQNRLKFQRFQRKDSEVLAVLDEYRSKLIKTARECSNHLSFVIADSLPAVDDLLTWTEIDRRLTLEEYLGIELRLKCIVN